MSQMTSNRPYLIRAIYQWICDNGMTPHVLVDAHFPGVRVPQDYVQDGHITLNIAPRSVAHFLLDNESLSFSARFAGVPQQIDVPPLAVLAIYARENGQGMAFDPVEPPEPPEPTADKATGAPARSHLKVIK